ncbi:GNAT family N-acetyltransferase [Pararhizobium sp. A13]|uniref:GNAT family N-acetyltransferase n=1 Tax=Pararhizobium sp. A13 TaxID=3133975 RepID=UPI0032433E8C
MPPIIRKASRADLDILIDWAAREGWNPGLDDAAAFWAADPEGFWIAEEDGVVAAALSLVRYDAAYAFLGFYMAHPDYRGQGIGFALWQRAISEAGNRTIGLDGVVAQQDNYRKSGFVYAHANFRYGGEVQCVEPPGTELVSVSPVHVPMLVDYDARFCPARRDAFLREWLKPLSTRESFALIRNAEVLGYGTIRACREGHKIGPLFADAETGADLIFRKLVTSVGGGQIYLDIPEPNAAARALCDRYNLKPVFETARMYRGPVPDLPLGQIYGITTFELG